jgi:23S rRNA pseudouridine2605 synthase
MLQRLQKIIAQAGIASRRHAEELIRSGQVRVNGEIVTELGSKADPEHDRVEVAGRVAEVPEERAYIVLHKPPQVVSTMADPEERTTLRHFLRGMPERVFPVGRLDYAASGLVLLTNDGELAARVLRAASRLRQTYWIKVKGRISESEMRDAGRAASAHFAPLKGPWARRSAENPWYEVELTAASRDALGRVLKRQDHPIEKMKRVQLGTLELDTVPEGHYRRLEPAEVEKFSRAVDRALAEKSEPVLPAQNVSHLAAPERPAAPPNIRPAFAPQNNRPSLAPPVVRPPYAPPSNRPRFSAPTKRPQDRPREPWRARQGSPPRQNQSGRAPGAPNHFKPSNPNQRPGVPPKQDWRAQKSGPWRAKKTDGSSQSRKQPWPGAPTHRPAAPNRGPSGSDKRDWRAQKSGPWRGNKTGGASSSPNHPRPGAPTHRPGSPNHRTGEPAKKDWRAQKPGAWRGNKTGSAPGSQNNSGRPERPARPRDSRPKRGDRPDRDPRHTPRHSR